jgi:hypothetical protein
VNPVSLEKCDVNLETEEIAHYISVYVVIIAFSLVQKIYLENSIIETKRSLRVRYLTEVEIFIRVIYVLQNLGFSH